MKKVLILLVAVLAFNMVNAQDYAKTPEDLGLSAKEYKKIKKKLKLKIINRDFDFGDWEKIYVGYKSARYPNDPNAEVWIDLWNETIYEMGLKQGNLDNALYIFVIGGGGLDLKVLDYLDNNTLVAKVTSPKNHRNVYTNSGRSKYKNYVKVFLNELLMTVRTD